MSVLFLAAPLPQANSSSLSSAPPEIPVPTVCVTRYLASGLTQMARCNFTPTIWENKHSSSDLLDFSVFCTLSQACTFVTIFMKLCRSFELRACKCGMVYGRTLLVLPPSYANLADDRWKCRESAFFYEHLPDFLPSMSLNSLLLKVSS